MASQLFGRGVGWDNSPEVLRGVKALDVSGFFFSPEYLLLWSFAKPRLAGLVSQTGELLTTFKSLLVISVVLCTRDGGKQPVWGMEPVLSIFCNFS